ncbi:hypothetical protein HUJ04_010865 [Dendroctonus ponderosae]|nr:hypothetical protein HUJ04_010865 [Dendroctonus ponderosae]
MGIELATHKTEAIILACPRTVKDVTFEIGSNIITTSKYAKYLGIYLDRNLRMTTHNRTNGCYRGYLRHDPYRPANKGKDRDNQPRQGAQKRVEQYNGWSKTFIQNVTKWEESKLGETNYYSTQAITGHGVFGSYLKKIKKQNNDDCWFCKAMDTPEHTIFDCQKFTEIRKEAEEKCNAIINKQNQKSAKS